MHLIEHNLYKEDIDYIANLELPWEKLKNKTLVVSGASGLIGNCFIDAIMSKPELNCKCYALGRDKTKGQEKFYHLWNNNRFKFIVCDINKKIDELIDEDVDYVLHLASNTHPLAYATDPIGTITTNIIGTQNMLEFALARKAKRVVFTSSNEIYGENRGDVELFSEEYCGYIDCNTMRAGYPESKRCGEALCQAYIKQKGLDVVIPRLTRSYGPTMLKSDTKAVSQFISKGVANEDIVLKSAGTQYYSYTYMADAVAGILTVMLCGECGQAYNIADGDSDIMLKDLAEIIANASGNKVVFEIPDAVEALGYSKATKARLDHKKINMLGWKAKYDIKVGIMRTLNILRDIID